MRNARERRSKTMSKLPQATPHLPALPDRRQRPLGAGLDLLEEPPGRPPAFVPDLDLPPAVEPWRKKKEEKEKKEQKRLEPAINIDYVRIASPDQRINAWAACTISQSASTGKSRVGMALRD